MSFSIGIVGLPNVGKSTLFKALTKKQVDISNYPFCTINPNIGVVKVPDERLIKLAEVLKPKEIIPTHIEFVDIAGLVKNAHQGEGLGNQFLSHIRKVDAIAEVVRIFPDSNIAHVSGKVDPLSDIETIKLELIFADLATINKRLEKAKKESKSGDKEAAKMLLVLDKAKIALEGGKTLLENCPEIKKHLPDLLTLKPIIYVLNIDEIQIKNSDNLLTYEVNIKICAKLEAELTELSNEEAKNYLKEYGLEKSGLDGLINAAYKILNLITFFTCQNQILQAWTITQNTKAPQAAGRIHTDFEKGFIKAEVINWQKLVECGSEQTAREIGLLKIEGKDYIVQDGDVIHFKFA